VAESLLPWTLQQRWWKSICFQKGMHKSYPPSSYPLALFSRTRYSGHNQTLVYRHTVSAHVAISNTTCYILAHLLWRHYFRLKGINGLNQGAGYQMPLRLMYAMAVTRYASTSINELVMSARLMHGTISRMRCFATEKG
jgi:hypothetical protein